MASRKLERAAAMVKQSVSKVILYELNDPRMKATITVLRVEVSPELRSADVFVSMLGEEAEVTTTYRALCHASGHITSLVGSRLSFRNTPVLRFILDDSLKKGIEVTQLINEAMEEIHQKEASQAEQCPDADTDDDGEESPTPHAEQNDQQ